MTTGGFFDLEFRLQDIDKNGDPLVALNTLVDWEEFREELRGIHSKDRKSPAGRKPFDPVLMLTGCAPGDPGAEFVMRLPDLDRVWILAEVFERQAAWVKPGHEAVVELDLP